MIKTYQRDQIKSNPELRSTFYRSCIYLSNKSQLKRSSALSYSVYTENVNVESRIANDLVSIITLNFALVLCVELRCAMLCFVIRRTAISPWLDDCWTIHVKQQHRQHRPTSQLLVNTILMGDSSDVHINPFRPPLASTLYALIHPSCMLCVVYPLNIYVGVGSVAYERIRIDTHGQPIRCIGQLD